MEQHRTKPVASLVDHKKLKPAVMAIRENLMIYYKGDCVRTTRNRWKNHTKIIPLSYVVERRRQLRSFQRDLLEKENKSLLIVKDLPLATLYLLPSRITFHRAVIERSNELNALHEELLKVLKTYLPHVRKDYTDARSPVYV